MTNPEPTRLGVVGDKPRETVVAMSGPAEVTNRQTVFHHGGFIGFGRIGEGLAAVGSVFRSSRRTGVAECRVGGRDGRLVATARFIVEPPSGNNE